VGRARPDRDALVHIGTGPIDGAWRAPYLECPACRELVEKASFDRCRCGAVQVDGDALRVIVRGVDEAEVAQYAKATR
jgi:hypothetical protein